MNRIYNAQMQTNTSKSSLILYISNIPQFQGVNTDYDGWFNRSEHNHKYGKDGHRLGVMIYAIYEVTDQEIIKAVYIFHKSFMKNNNKWRYYKQRVRLTALIN